MSVFPPEEITFLRLVEQAFLSLKGSGLMLSPRDVQRVREWERTGVPARVVVAAVEEGFATHRRSRGPTASAPRTLAYCEPAVLEAIELWHARTGGSRPAGWTGSGD